MPSQLQTAIEDVLKDVSGGCSRVREKSVSLFSGQRGANYGGELMVVGRAVNGYEPAFDPAMWADERTRARDAELALARDAADGLRWVTGMWAPQSDSAGNRTYSTGRSAFWRVLRGIAGRLGIGDQSGDWATYLTWTNLYKIAPVRTGNPSAGLARVQQAAAANALACELDTYAPKRVLFLTGADWFAPFASPLGLTDTDTPVGNLVQRIGRIRISSGKFAQAVVARHPQGKPEELFVAEVSEALGAGSG